MVGTCTAPVNANLIQKPPNQGPDAQEASTDCRRLRYFAKYMPPGGLPSVRLYGVYRATHHDDDFQYYHSIAQQALAPGGCRPAPVRDDASGRCRPDVPSPVEALPGATAVAAAAAAAALAAGAAPPPLAATLETAANAAAGPAGVATAGAAAAAAAAATAQAIPAGEATVSAAAARPGVACLQAAPGILPSTAATPGAVSDWNVSGWQRSREDLPDFAQAGLRNEALVFPGGAATQPWDTDTVLDSEHMVALLAGALPALYVHPRRAFW